MRVFAHRHAVSFDGVFSFPPDWWRLQEAGLEKEKEAASSLLQKAKAAEATLKEGERQAEATRCGAVRCRANISLPTQAVPAR